MNQTNKRFPTSNFYLSAYLLAHGINLIECDREDGGHVTFVFQDSDELIKRVNEFSFGSKALVDASSFVGAIKRLKSVIHDG